MKPNQKKIPGKMDLRVIKTFKPLSLIIFFLLLFSVCNSQKIKSKEKPDSSKTRVWKVIGPGGGGGVFLPKISPFDENLVLTHCDMTGAYISHNGGADWRMLNLWTVPNDFEFDPVNPNTIYIATMGYRHSEDRGSGLSILYRSEDKGEHWRIIYPDVGKAKSAVKLQGSDQLPSEIIEGAFDGSIQKVKVDPSDNRKIYLGLTPLQSYIGADKKNRDSSTVMLVLSGDHGKSWKLIAKLRGQNVKAIFPGGEGANSGEVIVFTESACFQIAENTGKIVELPIPVREVIAVAGGKNTFYIQSDFQKENEEIKGGMFVSKDRGRNWAQVNNGLLKDCAANKLPDLRHGFAVCETRPEVAYLSTVNPTVGDKGGIDEVFSIYKTINSGSNWEPVLLASSQRGFITKNFKGSWMERSFDPGWMGSPIDLGVAPRNPDVCFGGDARGFKTVDGGKTWEQAYSHIMPDSSSASNGLDVTTCYGVHFDPFDKNHFFVCYTDIGLFHTFNGGVSWFHSITNVPRDWQNTCYQIEFDPKIKGKVWSVWANAHDLPREKMFGRGSFDHFSGGVAVSNDDGHSWNKSNTGIPENSICTNILLDPATPVNSRTLYVSVFDKGVYKSTDGGNNWENKNNGLGDNLFAWQMRRDAKGRLFVLCSRGHRNGQEVKGEIFFSDDHAETWTRLTLPENVTGPHDLLIDPVKPNIMYVSCWPRTIAGKDVSGGVIKTEDGGTTWKRVFDESIRVNSAGMDPKQPNKIYINTFQNAAWRSEDYGETWKRIEGYRFKWGQRAIPDIIHPGMLYLTTYGGSVFYGPADGVPNAFEDIENMPEGWW
ncbi:MAG: hypothetical protein ABI863_23085 [Ginsengibacter sp.]